MIFGMPEMKKAIRKENAANARDGAVDTRCYAA